MKFDVLVKNGIIVSRDGRQKANIGIIDGKIHTIFSEIDCAGADKEYDATGKYILPGAIDAHVHAGYGEPHRETMYNASCAAVAGGITTILEQPLSNPSTVTAQNFVKKKEDLSKESVIDFGLWGGIVPGNYGELEAIYELGGGAYKSFMCRCSNYPMTDDGTLLKGMKKIGELGGLVAVHAENDTLIQQIVDDLNAEGKTDIDAFLNSHSEYTELEAIQRFIFLAQQAPNCKSHIVHMSVASGAELIAQAKKMDINISAETCPQYLGLCEDDLRKIGGMAKCDPPVRSKKNVDELWKYVINGTIDILASDHSPHPFDKKNVPLDEFNKASEGVTGLQSMIPIALTEGVHKRGMKLERLVEISSANVAKRFGLYPQKGCLNIGSDADFYILDLDKEWVCHSEDMHYVNKHTPYDGMIFKGYIEQVFQRGKLVCKDNVVIANKGDGQFLKLNMNV